MLETIFTSKCEFSKYIYLLNIIVFINIHSVCVELLSDFNDFIFGHLMER